jgi:hypothetical protein
MAFPDYVSDTTVNSVNYLLTSVAEIQRLFSATGIALHTDDLNPGNEQYDEENTTDTNSANFLAELCQRATSHVMTRLAPRYTIDKVYQNPRLREIATYWAAYKLTRRRGNEPVYEEEYIEAMDELDMFRRGELYLDAPSNGQRAYIQSTIVDLRYSRNPVRVIPEASTSTVAGQRLTRSYAFDWI